MKFNVLFESSVEFNLSLIIDILDIPNFRNLAYLRYQFKISSLDSHVLF